MASSTDISSHLNWLKSTGLSGDALYNRAYQDAKKYGVSADQVASAFGTDKDTVNNWVSSTGKAALGSGTASPSSSQKTMTNTIANSITNNSGSSSNKGLLQTATSKSVATPSTQKATSQESYTGTPSIGQIQEHVGWLESSGLSGESLRNQMYVDARRYGATASQVDQAMGWAAGTSNNWIQGKGLEGLGSATNPTPQEVLPDPSSITAAQIKEHFGWLQNGQNLDGAALQERVLQDAAKYGLTSDRVEAAMGWEPGTILSWSNAHGMTPLQDNRYQNTGGESATGWQTSPYVNPLNNQITANQTVSGQLNNLLSQDSPLMQRAAYQGMALANRRGLLNSSLAAGSAQAALIDAAVPIAQQDAQTYYEQSRANQNVTNDFRSTNLNYLQGAEQSSLDRAFNANQADLDREFNANQADLDRAFDFDQTEYKTNAQLAQTMAETRLTQSSGLYAQFIDGMAEINSSDMEQSAKDVALRSLWETISKGTQLSTSLANVTFSNGQLVYGGPNNDVGNIVSAPETRDSDQPSIYWGDGGYYEPNVTRNSAEQIVDKEGKAKPEGNYYLTDNGNWKRAGGTFSNNRDR